jgi:hypothetical protein
MAKCSALLTGFVLLSTACKTKDSRHITPQLNSAEDKAAESVAQEQQKPVEAKPITEEFTGKPPEIFDIVFAIDTSESMIEEKEVLEANLADFLQRLGEAQIDAQITAIGGKEKKDSKPFNFPSLSASEFGHLNVYIHSHDAIGTLVKYYKGDYDFPLPLRHGSNLEAVIISDNDGSNDKDRTHSLDEDELRNLSSDFRPPPGREVTVSAIVGLKKGKHSETCVVQEQGNEHIKLAEKTKGMVLDICSEDWSDLLATLSKKIISKSGFKLAKKPDLSKPIRVQVGGKALDRKDYSLSEDGNLKLGNGMTFSKETKVIVEYFSL